jgi:hypothetical protein
LGGQFGEKKEGEMEGDRTLLGCSLLETHNRVGGPVLHAPLSLSLSLSLVGSVLIKWDGFGIREKLLNLLNINYF